MFDLTNVEMNNSIIPQGPYNVALEEASLVETKSGNGQSIKAIFTVVSGPYKGRKIFHYFNVKNQNETARTIALQQLKSFLVSAGWKTFRFESVTELEGLKVNVYVKHEEGPNGPQPKIIAFKSQTQDNVSDTPF